MSVTKPDATVFDNDADSIATSRPELFTLATSFNTIADEYNAGTLGGGGGTLGTPTVLSTITSLPDTITPTTAYTQQLCNSGTGTLTVDMSNQPQDEMWEVLVIRQQGASGSPSVVFTYPGDSGGDTFTSSSTPVSAIAILFQVRHFSTPEPNQNRMFSVDTITIDGRLT